MNAPERNHLPLATGLACSILEWNRARADLDHTVVFVHGFLDLAWSFVACVNSGIADRYHVIAPDMRGHGDSDRIGAGGYYHFMDYIADLASVVDKLGRKKVSLLGHSMGGSVVAYYAGAFPERVHRLALLEGLGPPEDETPHPERVAHWISAWENARDKQPRAYADIDAAARRLSEHDPRLSPELARELALHGTRELEDGRRVFKHDPVHLTRGPYPFRLDVAQSFWRRIRCPVLLVDGAESPFRALADLEARIACFANARRATIADAAHMLQRHQPRALAELLLDQLG